MKKNYLSVLLFVVFFLSLSKQSFAATDLSGDNIGVLDLTSAYAELYDRGDLELLKITISSSPHIPGVIIFECDVDNSTGTGGSTSMLGVPVSPCPCKTTAGFDIVITLFLRQQGDNSGSAICGSCSDTQGACAKGRKPGQWFATTSVSDQLTRNVGVLSGDLDPLPEAPASGEDNDCYTLPWSHILGYAYQELQGDPKRFNLQKAMQEDNNKWQLSIWYDDAFSDQDDISDNYPPGDYFNISDWIPNGDGIKADMEGPLSFYGTYCEGNFDDDLDVDGGDAAVFKSDFGRSGFFMACPRCSPKY
jgi:hypothetical protein